MNFTIKTFIYSGFFPKNSHEFPGCSCPSSWPPWALAQEGLHYGAQLAVCYDGQMVHFSVGEVWESGPGKKLR